jgi:hypothetical protein
MKQPQDIMTRQLFCKGFSPSETSAFDAMVVAPKLTSMEL